MALKIRLRRMGRKKAPTYRIVVAESTMPRDGRFVASIGHYNPRSQPIILKVEREKALFWIDQGAIPTDTARSLLKRAGVFGPAPTVTEEATEAVKKGARQAAERVQAAAETAAAATGVAAETVREAVADAAETVRETVAGESAGETAAEERAPAESEAEAGAGEAADEEKAAKPAE